VFQSGFYFHQGCGKPVFFEENSGLFFWVVRKKFCFFFFLEETRFCSFCKENGKKQLRINFITSCNITIFRITQ